MDTANTTAATTGNTDREAAYAEAAKLKPTRYTSDPDVINSPEESAKVQALWTVYFNAMDAALIKYPYTEEEKAAKREPPAPPSTD
jgi:hypothetical protein